LDEDELEIRPGEKVRPHVGIEPEEKKNQQQPDEWAGRVHDAAKLIQSFRRLLESRNSCANG
jgi:hypothetical protein